MQYGELRRREIIVLRRRIQGSPIAVLALAAAALFAFPAATQPASRLNRQHGADGRLAGNGKSASAQRIWKDTNSKAGCSAVR
jgi:hypothetical protein